MAKKTFGKRALALLMVLLIVCGTMNLTAFAARGDRPGSGSGTVNNVSLYWCYNRSATGGSYSKNLGQATATYNGGSWGFGSGVSLAADGSATITINPEPGYRVARIDMLCTGAGNNENPYSCRTYNEGASYRVRAVDGSASIRISNFTVKSACNHTSRSTKYYVMVTLEEVEIEKTYTVTYTPGAGQGTNYTDNNGSAGYAFLDAYNVLAVTNENIGFTNPGYTFAGWEVTACADTNSLYSILGNDYQGGDSFSMPAGDVVLTAKWEEVQVPTYDYTVTYNANFGDNETKSDAENALGVTDTAKDITIDANPFDRPGYTFQGWATEPNGNVVYQAEQVLSFTQGGQEELFAVWQAIPTYDYTVIYNANFGDNETKADAENALGVTDTTKAIGIDQNPFIRPGYTFQGWATEPTGAAVYQSGMSLNFTMGGQEELFAVWKEIPKYDYTVTYNANFGEAPEVRGDAENIQGVYELTWDIGVDGCAFVRENYTFIGWNTDQDGNGTAYAPGDEVALTAANNTAILYAQWEENAKYDYSVIYNANFGANATALDAENVTGVYDLSWNIGVDANPFVRENYIFTGWNTDPNGNGTAYAPGDVVALTAENNTAILYAQWEELPKYDYTVIYNANFGENPATAADAENVLQVYDTAKTITVDACTFVRENYDFIGWATEPEGNVVYLAGDTITFENGGSAVLYARWAEHNKYSYTLVYNGNGGTLADGNLAYGDAENVADVYDVEKAFTVDANTFIRSNFTFLGWNTAADGFGTAYTAEQALLLTAQNNTCTLYAQWQENPKYDYTVIYNANFGDAPATAADAENALQVYDITKTIQVDGNVFVRDNYVFLGWAIEPNGAVAYAPGDEIVFNLGGEQELFALWQIQEYAYTVEYLVRIDDGAFTPFDGTLPEGTVTGGVLPYGTLVDKDVVAPPEALVDGKIRYTYATLDPIVIAEEGNVVKVYYQYNTPAPIDDDPPNKPNPPQKPDEPDVPDTPDTPDIPDEPTDPPVVDIPEEDVPLADVPKTGDPMILYAGIAAACGGGFLWMRKKEEDEE